MGEEPGSLKARVRNLPLIGLITVFVSASLFGLQNVIVKKVESVDPFTIAFYRFLGIGLPAFSIVIYRAEDPFPAGKRVWLIIRCVFGASNLLIHFYGLKHMPIADANMISAASPIWTVILSRIFLKEPLKYLDLVNVFLTLTGLLLIIRPPFIFGHDSTFAVSGQYYMAAMIVLAGTVLQASVYILLRLLKGIHYSVTLSNFGTIGTLESAVFMMTVGGRCVPPCEDRYSMLAVGFVSFLAQILLTVSLQLEEAGKVSIMRKAGDILFAFLFQVLFFQELPGLLSVLGALLVTVAVFINGGSKIVDSLPADHAVKTKYLSLCYSQPPQPETSQIEENIELRSV